MSPFHYIYIVAWTPVSLIRNVALGIPIARMSCATPYGTWRVVVLSSPVWSWLRQVSSTVLLPAPESTKNCSDVPSTSTVTTGSSLLGLCTRKTGSSELEFSRAYPGVLDISRQRTVSVAVLSYVPWQSDSSSGTCGRLGISSCPLCEAMCLYSMNIFLFSSALAGASG